MKQTLTLRYLLPLCMVALFNLTGGGKIKAQAVVYTLDFTTKAVNQLSYDNYVWTYPSNGIDWTMKGAANGAGSYAYVRTGGQTQNYSYYQSKSPISGEVTSIVLQALNIRSATSFTMQSIKLTVALDANFTNVVDEMTQKSIATTMTFTPSEGKTWKNAYYKFYFTWKNTATKSNSGMDVEKLTFYGPVTAPSFTTQPQDATYELNASTPPLTVKATGTPAPTYQWYVHTENSSSGGTPLEGETASEFMPGTAAAGTAYYYCVATNEAGSVTSDVATVTVNPAEETGYSLSVSEAGYATYFNSERAYVLPEGCEGFVWTGGGIVSKYVPGENDIVPANEPLVIKADAGTYRLQFTTTTNESYKLQSQNDLEGTDEATAIPNDDAYYYYGLSLNKSGDWASVGFYWMNATGAAFTNGAHKAYLKLAKERDSDVQSAMGYAFDDMLTGVGGELEAHAPGGLCYDLTGRPVLRLQKGIYIRDGKKILVK
ncbi:MAG: hypothetical protein ACI3YD_08220 [Alloprevotella sp.]